MTAPCACVCWRAVQERERVRVSVHGGCVCSLLDAWVVSQAELDTLWLSRRPAAARGRAPGHWGWCAPSDLCHPHPPLVPRSGAKLKAKTQLPGSAPVLGFYPLPEVSPYTKIPGCSL